MFISSLSKCQEFIAGDKTLLRELLHPAKQPLSVRYSLAHARLAPGETSLRHRLQASEVYYILGGQGRMHIEGEASLIKKGDAIYIPPGASQYIENLGSDELVFLCIVDPAWRAEDEVIES
ncbi:MAG: cupin domain-containing protein [Calditrichaeota bacterium]|nr:cupin domain-containing protein [Calditrichota bacterium]